MKRLSIRQMFLNVQSLLALFFLAASLTTSSAQAAEEAFGDLVVYYNAFDSTFLLPKVAKSYGIERSPKGKLLNVSVLKNGKPSKSDVKVETSNLLGQIQTHKTWAIEETGALYYMTAFNVTNDELLHFTITVSPEGYRGSKTIKFSQKFYEE